MSDSVAQKKTHGSRLPYLPGLDGLRALAVIAVLLYHAQVSWIPGGFLGVEVFFVLSGFLITSLLLAEWRERGAIDLKDFWLRRARRLLPALLLLLATTLTYAVLFLPDEVAGLRSDAVAAVGYVTNWHLILSNTSYFEAVGRPSLLRHLWSLAVEEQFYLLWPLIFAFAMMRWRARGFMIAILGGSILSAGLMAALFDPSADPSRVYFGTDTRAAGLLLGSALAFVWVPGQLSERGKRLPLDLIGLGALGALALLHLRLDEFQPLLYQGGFALVAIATCVLTAVVVHPRARVVPGLLGWRPLRWVGTRSYGIYLWHWPVFMLTRPYLDVAADGVTLLASRLALTLVLAELSYRLVETPIRKGALGRSWRALREAHGAQRQRLGAQWAGTVAILVLFASLIGHSVVNAQPPPPPSYLSVQAINDVVSTSEPPVVSPLSLPGISDPVEVPIAPVPIELEASIVATATEKTTETHTINLPLLALARPTTSTLQIQPTEVIAGQIRSADEIIHLVERGESLYRISLRYGTTVEAIAAANDLSDTRLIYPGQRLLIPIQADRDPDGSRLAPELDPSLAAIEEFSTAHVPSAPPATPTPDVSPRADLTAEDLIPVAGEQDSRTGTLEPVVPVTSETPAALTEASTPSRVAADGNQTEPAVPDADSIGPVSPGGVTAVGDSVMLGAVNQLVQVFGNLDVDAQVSRQASAATEVLRVRRAEGRLGEVVIIHIGNNGILRASHIDEMMQLLADVRRVVFINVRVPRQWEAPNNATLAEKVQQYPNAVLVDWHGASFNRPELFWEDGIHLRPGGAQTYAALIASAVSAP